MISLLVIVALPGMFALAALFYFIVFPLQPVIGELPKLSDWEQQCTVQLLQDIKAIALRPHNLDHPDALEEVAHYIEHEIKKTGLTPQRQEFEVDAQMVRNVEIVFEPSHNNQTMKTIVIGAHYDSPETSPGANDNGSGVAALLAIVRALKTFHPEVCRLGLVFFVNEEAPYGKTKDMGSWRHAKMLNDAGESVAGMIALETLGYFSNKPGSQKFPWPFQYIYSDVGNFVAFVGEPRSRKFLRTSLALFRKNCQFPSIGAVAPNKVEGVDLSDHWAYGQFDYPAFMISDTAPFRNPMYHSDYDLPGAVDCECLARITSGLIALTIALANMEPS